MKKITFAAGILSAFLLTGCAVTKPEPLRQLPVIENDKAKITAELFMQQFLSAIQNDDSSVFDKKILVESIADNIGQNTFSQYRSDMIKHLGKITRDQYVCSLANPLYHSFVWKLTCQRKPESKENNEMITAEVLFHVQIVHADDQYKVLNFIITR